MQKIYRPTCCTTIKAANSCTDRLLKQTIRLIRRCLWLGLKSVTNQSETMFYLAYTAVPCLLCGIAISDGCSPLELGALCKVYCNSILPPFHCAESCFPSFPTFNSKIFMEAWLSFHITWPNHFRPPL